MLLQLSTLARFPTVDAAHLFQGLLLLLLSRQKCLPRAELTGWGIRVLPAVPQAQLVALVFVTCAWAVLESAVPRLAQM